jgi:urease accessory protein
MIATQPTTPYRLKGRLDLHFAAGQHKTILNVTAQTPPLKVIRAFEQESGSVLVHLHNVSGGILSGDSLEYNIDLAPDTEVQLTTTSATRVYRRREGAPSAVQCTDITIGKDALLEYVPDPVIPFAHSLYRQETHIKLEEGAGLFWWETIAPGRTTRGELFEYDKLELVTSICVDDYPIALEHTRLEPALRPLLSPVRLGSYRYFSTFYICKVGLEQSEWLALEVQLRTLALELSQRGEVTWGVSTLVAHGLVIRGLSMNGRTLTAGLLSFWQVAKQSLYGCAAVLPRKIY